ncbi:DNA-binding protein [Lysinibacillus capsici]|uniref:DNA-binding protein n=1 Tax=Lysinibacillus capsici TaxID=2115968 RepID=UPI0032E52C1D
MRIELEIPQGLEDQIRNVVLSTIKDAFSEFAKYTQTKEWMSLKEGAEYAGVSFNTFKKFREMGLKVSEIDGVKRVSKAEIDKFLEYNSF